MSQDQQLYDFFDGDPEYEHGYHQDHQGDPWTYLIRPTLTVPAILAAITVVYEILYILDYNLLSIPELLWNIVVYIVPWRLLDAVERFTNPLRTSNPMLRNIARTHAMKSEAMRRILGLDTPGGIMGSVASASRRRLSTLPGINLVTQGVEGRPAGLGNWDNSCYQNSVLQGLASLDSLSRYLTTPPVEGEAMEGTENPDLRMGEALRGLIATLNDPSNNGKRIWTPAILKNMSSWQQQDAQEYFSKVLDEIDKEVGKVAKLNRTSHGFESDGPSFNILSSPTPHLFAFRNPLEGLIAQRVGCTRCGYSEGLSMIPFNCLTVPLGRAYEYDVAECLNEYTKLEQIEGVECGKCTLLKHHRQLSTIAERVKELPGDAPIRISTKNRLAAVSEALEDNDFEEKTLLNKCHIPPKNRVASTKTRQAVIARPPKSLVVHFNRSVFDERTGDLKKNYAEVKFPKVLDLGPWCLGSYGKSQNPGSEDWVLDPEVPMISSTARPSRLRGPLYELRAVVTHYGRHENGHYICYRRQPSVADIEKDPIMEQWWRFSDDEVTKVSEENVLSQGGVFMLFFDLVGPAKMIGGEQTTSVPNFSEQKINSEPVAFQPARDSIGSALPEELELAINVPLPDFDDADLSVSNFSSSNQEDNIEASVSEFDEEETRENEDQRYSPTKAILVPQYIRQTGVHNEGEEAGRQGIVPASNLVMV
jgi:ubiquitin carboxyl-terminal hydrolase 1